jgi:hypothetical protein
MQPRYSRGTAEIQPRYAPRRGPTGSWRRRAPERFHASSEKLPSKFREGCRSEHHHILALAVLGAAAAHAVHLDAQRANGCLEEQRSCVLPASDSGDLNHPRDLPRCAEVCRDVPRCAEVCRDVPRSAEPSACTSSSDLTRRDASCSPGGHVSDTSWTCPGRALAARRRARPLSPAARRASRPRR